MKTLLRGRTLSFDRRPNGIDDLDALSYFEDGAVVLEDGKILAMGPYSDLQKAGNEIDHRPYLIVPGLIDPHTHFPQVQVIGAYAAALLDWLNDHTFPEEARFADQGHADRIAGAFFDQLILNGTTTALAFCTSSPVSAHAYFAEAERRSMRMLGGKTLMDRNAPDALCDTAERAYSESKALIQRWHGRGRLSYAITPRFAITSTEAQLEATSALKNEFSDLHLQTHLSENPAEIALTAELFPKARDYLDVYDQYDLLGPKSLMGHAIHLSPRERDRMAESGTVAVHCPTSNLFLGSGLFDKFGLEANGVRTAVATDIGGGTSWSLLRTLGEAYKIQQLRGERLNPLDAFFWATRGNAEALGMVDLIGTLAPGSEADIVVLDSRATSPMALRMERVDTLSQELFVLQTLGDDRSVRAVYVGGKECARAVTTASSKQSGSREIAERP